MSDEAPDSYRINIFSKAAEQIKTLGLIAKQRDILGIFSEELSFIASQLELSPLSWGEPAFEMRQLALFVFRSTTRHLIVHFAVHRQSRTVFLHDVQPLPGSLLDLKD